MGSAGSGEAFLRQLSLGGGAGGGGGCDYSYCSNSRRGSRRWGSKKSPSGGGGGGGGGGHGVWGQTSGAGAGGGTGVAKKRVMVVIDHSGPAKQAMMWALTHVANKGDILTLLHVVPPPPPPPHPRSSSSSHSRYGRDDIPNLANTLGSLCKACKPEVEVEALVIQGPKLATVLSQVRKLETSVLVLSQSKPSPFCCFFQSRNEEFVEQCIDKADCLTLAVRKQSKGVGGYLISTRWQKNFWLLA